MLAIQKSEVNPMSLGRVILAVAAFAVAVLASSVLLTKFLFHPAGHQIVLGCPRDNPMCHKGGEISFSFESPVRFNYVFRNSFRLKGSIHVPGSLGPADLCITGGNCTDPNDPRCHHVIDLKNGLLGPGFGAHGGDFDVMVTDQLFSGHNNVEAVFSVGLPSLPNLIGQGEVFLVTAQGPSTQ
jgi:hypothetical protein